MNNIMVNDICKIGLFFFHISVKFNNIIKMHQNSHTLHYNKL